MIDHLDALLECKTVSEIWALHSERMASYGFDRLLYGFTWFRTPNSFGDPQDLMLLTNHEPDYMDRFINEGMYNHAPMVRWAVENSGFCSWKWMQERARDGLFNEREMEVIEFNRTMNVTAGYSISFRDSSVRAKGAIALTAKVGMTQEDADAVWAEHGRDIHVMNKVLHLKLVNLPFAGARRALTQRQREALEWVGDGKTTQDIAQIMGLTPATVEKHLRLARIALDVETTTQAVLKASYQKQIFSLEL